MKVINEVVTLSEASQRWGIPQITLKNACAGQKGYPPRFTLDECRKSGRTWLVTRQGMERLYGKELTGK